MDVLSLFSESFLPQLIKMVLLDLTMESTGCCLRLQVQRDFFRSVSVSVDHNDSCELKIEGLQNLKSLP